ncbi:MAG: hypothetical protein GX916_03350 [Clostridiales bacterium]|nr:hypothetical protein [Clostridiales bacterium]
MSEKKQSRTVNQKELQTHWQEQINFLIISSSAYDNGQHSESKRLALGIRILLHDSKNSLSLAKQLGIKNNMLFWSSASLYTPSNLLSSFNLLSMRMTSDGFAYIPILTNVTGRTFFLIFDDWWNEVVFDDKQSILTRRDVILTTADQDGGAHVDPEINEDYAKIAKDNSLGWTFVSSDDGSSSPPLTNPVYATVRQIACELLCSITISEKGHFKRLAYPERKFEMRYFDSTRRFLWSQTDIQFSEETKKIVELFNKQPRKYYVDRFADGFAREVVLK